ncbi:hypothetical protein [Actinomadura roseirufa]|uniref:hypothetical protein n=1 Tax=Actinomadura roseirufa TaxID=2094049 RepID=UPI0013F166F9|nr:hypothetical protein [Actinomadura roseirufa]
MARIYSHPQGAGLIGADADGLLRATIVDALTTAGSRIEVVVPRADLDHLFGPALRNAQLQNLHPALHPTKTLEDSIEYLEGREGSTTAEHTSFLWIASPGNDADVVHQALQHHPDDNLIALFRGAWPYGPTHLIDKNRSGPLYGSQIELLSPGRAIAKLVASTSWPCH